MTHSLRGELGDLLFQVVFYAQMAQEEGRFDFNDICAAISDKLERRHPHVFADSSAENSSECLPVGSKSKPKSARRKRSIRRWTRSRSLPALMRAQKIQKRCANVGFDWTTLGPVVDKVYEEIDEVMYEARQAVIDQAKLEEEMGDLLFATVNLARHLGTKAEIALQKANEKFERRFREVERIVAARGLEMTGVDLETMEEVWQQVKRQEIDQPQPTRSSAICVIF
ncbi:nucleoside triphosphate pyrophosphohydrolase [Escherichia coli]